MCEHCASIDATWCFAESPDGWHVCNRPEGHDGPHCSCGFTKHHVAEWDAS